MTGRGLLSQYLLLMAALSGPPPLQSTQTNKTATTLSVEEVIKLSQSGFSEELIITKIKKNAKPFDLSAEELMDIKKAGVSDNVIKYLLDPSQPYTLAAPPKVTGGDSPVPVLPKPPSTPAKQYPKDALASRVPYEPGLYFFQDAAPLK